MKHVPKVTLKEMLTNSMLRQPLVIAMFMMMAQQLSGINCVSYFVDKKVIQAASKRFLS